LAAAVVVSVVAMLAGLLALATNPLGAQAIVPATFVVGSPTAAPDGGGFDVVINLTPGDETVGAFSGVATYDDAAFGAATACTVLGGAGSCNNLEAGVVRFSILAVAGFSAANILEISFANSAEDASVAFSVANFYGISGETLETPIVEYVAIDPVDPPELATGSLTGAVSSAIDGAGLFDIGVCIGTPTLTPKCVLTDGLGNYRLDDLVVGTYNVEVGGTGLYAGSEQLVAVTESEVAFAFFELQPAAVVTEPPTPTAPQLPVDPIEPPVAPIEPPVEFIEPPVELAGTISGTVTNSMTGEPVLGIQICATIPVVGTTECTISDTSGEYEITELLTSNYIVTAVDFVQRFRTDTELLVGVFENAAVTGADFVVTPR